MDFSCKAVLAIVVCTAVFRISPGQELVTNCSSSGYTPGTPGDVLCQLDRSYYTSSCGLPPTRVQFAFFSPAGARSTYCTVDFSPFPSSGTPEPANCPSCNCSSDTTGSEYTLTFTPDSTVHYNGRIQCEVSCFSGNPTENHSSCNPIPLLLPSTTTSATKPVPPPNGCDINDTVGIENCTLNNGPHSGWVISGSDMLRWDFQNSKVVVLCYCCKEWVKAVIPVIYCLVSLIFCCILLIWRRPFFDDTWERWQILIRVIGFIVGFNLGPVWFITYMTTAGVCGYYPFYKCTCICIETTPPILPDCPRDDEHPDWEYAVFCLGLIFLLAFCLYFIVTICKKWWPFQPDTEKRLIVRLQLGAAQSGSARFYELLGKCGKCHKWYLFSVTLDDNKLQNIFIQENLNEIFKKCANHGPEEFSLQEVKQKIQEILTKCRMGDIRNVTLAQTVCLKDYSRDMWYKQDHDPGQAVLEAVMKGEWSWSEGAGTALEPGGLMAVLQIRLYLQSKRLLVKCGECHKWCCFTVTLEDHTLQDIFIRPNLDNIFKKCANHDEEELSLREVEKMIQKLAKRRMDDIRNVTLAHTICLKDYSRDMWYKQDHEPSHSVLNAVMRGRFEGAGTAVNPEELKDILQIRLYLQSNSAPYANQ